MKKQFLVFPFLVLFFTITSCGTLFPQQKTIVISSQNISADPAGKAYRTVRFENQGPFWRLVPIGKENLIIGPNSGATTMIKPGFYREFGNFTIMSYAYREYDGKRLSGYIGEQEHWFYLNGYPVYHNGQTFGAVVIMSYCPVSPFPGPTKWKGNFLGLIPWKAEIR